MKKGCLEKLWNGVHLEAKEEKQKIWKLSDPRNNNWNESEGPEKCGIDGQGEWRKMISH